MARMHWQSMGLAFGLGLGAMVGLASPSFGGPAVASRWQNAKMSQEECLKRAEDTIAKAGLGRLERTEQSRYGTKEDYTGVVRCITSNGIARFIGSDPSRSVADNLSGMLFRNFKTE
ncbi:MAG: hypothetical protein EXQ82_11140 [Pseudolabrys sp.]|nr:hypothetical protein [Pseudolabrys sp.]